MIDERAPEAAKPCVPARHFSKQIDLTNSIKPIILLISDLFQPLIWHTITRDTECEMGKPTVRCGSVPMLDICRNMNYHTGQYLHCRTTLLLMPSAPGYTDEHLTASTPRMMDMPIIATTRLECHIGKSDLRIRNISNITVADKILCIDGIRLPYHATSGILQGLTEFFVPLQSWYFQIK